MTQNPATSGRADCRTLEEFADYAGAQRLVDLLSDRGLPMENVRIVGTGMRSVEQVTGRQTNAQAALRGAVGGAWFGLLIGLLFSIFVIGGWFWLWMLLLSALIDAVFGAIFGFIDHAATGGRARLHQREHTPGERLPRRGREHAVRGGAASREPRLSGAPPRDRRSSPGSCDASLAPRRAPVPLV